MGIFQSLNEITLSLQICDPRAHIERILISSKTAITVDSDSHVRFYVKCCLILVYLPLLYYLMSDEINCNMCETKHFHNFLAYILCTVRVRVLC